MQKLETQKSIHFNYEKIPHIIFTWQRSADINILELLDGLPELDERGRGLPHHHRALVGPAGVKGEVVEGAVIDPLSEQCSLQGAGHQLLLKQGHTNVKQAILQSHMNINMCHHWSLYTTPLYRRFGNFRVKKLSYDKFSCKKNFVGTIPYCIGVNIAR